ncbi:hypothetical protein BJ138DRAFT_1011272 [Hygrophoropsis aurantiaca]|uniref:Uncharacterized protein n=1 Tax=Hygrophoropsis aurantiaca TaxID=72124 RepID=A0ACB8A6S2_9AGAM|nr:hypothetical protein BJ138DRAFT_1011272 [Hygrophoropsis aurantiaca]
MLKLPIEDVHGILDHLSFDSLQKLSCVSSLFRVVVVNYLNRRKSMLFARFVDDVPAFNDLLRTTSSVVSGSLALQFILPSSSLQWPVKDMDIYTGRSQTLPVVSFLVAQGYEVSALENSAPHYTQIAIRSVITMSNGPNRIDIVVSNTRHAIRPIFQFHSTPVINYLTADSIFSAYPKLTTNYRGLFNALSLRDGRRSLSNMQAIAKYAYRGFDIQSTPAAWDAVDEKLHVCVGNINCLQETRTSEDSGCLWMSLDAERVPKKYDRLEHPVAMWQLGAVLCDGSPGPAVGPVLIMFH